MSFSKFHRGIDILAKYYKDQDGYHIEACRDVIYVHSTDTPVSAEDCKTLWGLGWCQEGHDSDEGEYGPDAAWCFFT